MKNMRKATALIIILILVFILHPCSFSQVSYDISEESKGLVLKASHFVDQVVESERIVYGINTGFGKLSDTEYPVGS